MTDLFSIKKIELLHPKLRDEALLIYGDIERNLTGNAKCRFLSTLRTFAEQDALYQQGRTKPGKIVTNARAGTSYHNYSLAIDIVIIADKDMNGTYESALWDVKSDFDKDGKADWIEAVHIFKSYGWEWGGDWKFSDPPHFQKTFGYSIQQLKALHDSKRVDKNGYVLI